MIALCTPTGERIVQAYVMKSDPRKSVQSAFIRGQF
jgi:hypothetical protein